ncbi:amidohydrolase family protein [Streptomyces sp. NP160]|uniref:amidohydrolase family protein n=1 Tax=Streptomyces sp. NP160 TaxID=2586637 RepID=UPI001C5707A7|nr:amidohydrolase [Streptomyces sp. NP160]
MSAGVRVLAAGVVVVGDAAHTVLTDGAVALDGDRITAVGPREEVLTAVRAEHPGAPVEELPDHLLVPGLVNAHHHSGLLRGTAEELPVWEWLRVHIDPMHRVLTAHEAEVAARLCYAEGLLAGTTTVVDMWRYLHGGARAAELLGNRLVAVPYAAEHPEHDFFDTLDDVERLAADHHGSAGGRVEVWVGLEHPFYAVEAAQQRAVAMARDLGTGLYTHCSESRDEVAEFERRYGARPVRALERLGMLDAPRTVLAHAVWLDDDEIGLLAERGVGVVHNPVSNMKLASGTARVRELLAAGVAVGLGTDGEKENNNLDVFEELKAASLLAKLRDLDAAALPSWDAFALGTTGGARALGREADLGSLEVGKKADVVAVRSRTPRMTPLVTSGPLLNVHHNLVHAVRGSDVDHVWVDGAPVVRDGALVHADLGELVDEARATAPGLFARREAWVAEHGLPEVAW